jgi:hypothetical protein
VDIAAERDGAGDRKALRARLIAAVEIDLEARRLREAVDAVAHDIEIGEGDRGALRHDQGAGNECLIALGHGIAPREGDGARAAGGRRNFDHRAFDGQAALVEDLDNARLRPRCRNAEQAGKPERQPRHEAQVHMCGFARFS